jgi:hypothetical protein
VLAFVRFRLAAGNTMTSGSGSNMEADEGAEAEGS